MLYSFKYILIVSVCFTICLLAYTVNVSALGGAVTCDNTLTLYVDGFTLATSYAYGTASFVTLSEDSKVVGIECYNSGGAAGILASFDNGVVTDSSWRCSATAPTDWASESFDDATWVPATALAAHGSGPWGNIAGVSSAAKWIWDSSNSATVHCRRKLPSECVEASDLLGVYYTGTVDVTLSGRTCQRWDAQSPHTHSETNTAITSLDQNYCRNPNNHGDGAWCLTTDPAVVWEKCDVPVCNGSAIQTDALLVKRADRMGFNYTLVTDERSDTCEVITVEMTSQQDLVARFALPQTWSNVTLELVTRDADCSDAASYLVYGNEGPLTDGLFSGTFKRCIFQSQSEYSTPAPSFRLCTYQCISDQGHAFDYVFFRIKRSVSGLGLCRAYVYTYIRG